MELPRRDLKPLLIGRDRRQRDEFEPAFFEQVAGQVIFVQALHDEDDDAAFLVVETADQAVANPFIHDPASALGLGIARFQRVVIMMNFCSPARQRAPTDVGISEPVHGRSDLDLGVLTGVDPVSAETKVGTTQT